MGPGSERLAGHYETAVVRGVMNDAHFPAAAAGQQGTSQAENSCAQGPVELTARRPVMAGIPRTVRPVLRKQPGPDAVQRSPATRRGAVVQLDS